MGGRSGHLEEVKVVTKYVICMMREYFIQTWNKNKNVKENKDGQT